QGDQHHRPIDFFGGEEAFARGVERDKKKKALSEKYGVKQFDILPGYDLEEVIYKVAKEVYPEMQKENMTRWVESAVKRARKIARSTLTQAEDRTAIVRRISSKSENAALSEFRLEQRIKKLVSMRKKSPYAGDDGLDVPRGVFEGW